MSRPRWVLLVTGGTVVEYPPEVYADLSRATTEAERWAWVLSGAGWLEIERPFPDRWRVGEREVRLVSLTSDGWGREPLWVGVFWDRDGTPDPEAVLFEGREEARAWVLQPPAGIDKPIETEDLEWFASATYVRRGEEEYAVAHLAKVVS